MTTADDLLRRVQQFLDNGDLTGEALRLSIAVDAYLDAPKDEPVAWMDEPVAFIDGPNQILIWAKPFQYNGPKSIKVEPIPLYLHPPTKTTPKKPMTEEQYWKLISEDYRMEEYGDAAYELIRKVERYHGIGGGEE